MTAENGHAEDIYEGQSQERFFDGNAEIIAANMKRTYDAYQDLDLSNARAIQNLTVQALQNAIATTDMVAKQALRHTDIAIENQWESSAEVSGEAVLAALAAAVSATLTKE
jgi:hypothetical protein